MAGITIGKLAATAGVGVETVRYYQRRALLAQPEPGDPYGGVRRYDQGDVQRLRFIRAAQGAGFTLEQIGELLALDAVDDRTKARALAVEQIAALDARIAALTGARDALARLAYDCAVAGSGRCPILTAFEGA
jgi:MerR family mercuric resistance operon transcriptional regulator